MGRHKKQITLIEENCKFLLEFDSHKQDRRITITEFNMAKEKKINKIDGKQIDDWKEYKLLFKDYQETIGFEWRESQGHSGPIKLETIRLNAELGTELASKYHKEEIKSGNFYEILKTNLPTLFEYLKNDIDLLKFKDAKEEFKVPDGISGFGFKFKPNSHKFERKLLEYKFQSENKGRHETELGNILIPSLKEELELDFIYHTQEEREGQKFKNIDIEGIKIVKTESEDHFNIYAFELKASNSIPSVSEAISQAINYKACSNYAYIIVPNFDFENFYDEIRLREYIEMCRQNELGIISVVMKGNTLSELNIILEAPKTELSDFSRIISLSQKKEFNYEKCHLCGKIVDKDYRKECGWQVSLEDEDGSHCMKLIQQEQAEMFIKSRKLEVINDSTLIVSKNSK